MHANRGLNVIQRQIVSLHLVVALSEQHIGPCVGLLIHLEPDQERIDALLPPLLNKVELRYCEAGVDLHCQRNIWLRNHLLVITQRLGIIFIRVAQERVQVVDVSQLVTVKRPLTIF